jgi:hypothetical protein
MAETCGKLERGDRSELVWVLESLSQATRELARVLDGQA